MSLEQKIEELTGQVTALTAIITQQMAVQERLAAGQAAALEKIEGGKAAAEGKATRGRKPKDEAVPTPEPKAEEPASTASGEAVAASASSEVPFADYAKAWMTEGLNDVGTKQAPGKDWAEYAKRGKNLMAILGHFGVSKVPELSEDDQTKARFYIDRFKAGKEVDFDADYDFAGDPAQDVEVDEDPFG